MRIRNKYFIQEIIKWLKDNGTELPNLLPKLNPDQAKELSAKKKFGLGVADLISCNPFDFKLLEALPTPDPDFFSAIRNIYQSLKPEERAFVNECLTESGNIIFPMAVALGICAFEDYGFVNSEWDWFENDYEYLVAYRVGMPDESELKDIQLGESTNREFKSTFRFNLYTKKNGEIMEYKNVFIIDSTNFTNIPAGSISLTIMANALRIATESLND